MSLPNIAQYAVFLLIVTLLVRPVGGYLTRVFAGERTLPDPILRPVERAIYRVAGTAPELEMSWHAYAVSFVLFGLAGTLFLYALLRLQQFLPWFDPAHQTSLTPDLAMNIAIGFTTTTTWQPYSGETTMSYVSQILALTVGMFAGGAAGLAVGIAFIRGLARERGAALGNFWVDLVRAFLWVLLPLSVAGTLILLWQGVPLNWNPYTIVTTLQHGHQVIAQGPVALMEPIENLGTNGGGFFNVNAAHPYQNPTPLTNFLLPLGIVILPAALTNTFGRMVGSPRQGWLLYWVMAGLFAAGLLVCAVAEQHGNSLLTPAGVDQALTAGQGGGNLEGKDVRFGIGGSVLNAIATSNTSTGSYNSMLDSYTPVGGMVTLVNLLLGEIIFGGLGGGLYSIIMVALVGVFVAGLMVGRTPEWLGKKLGASEMKLVVLYALVGAVALLVPMAVAVATSAGRAGLVTNTGPHGFTEIIYAYASSFANNGVMYAGLNANSPFYNSTTALVMLAGRYGLGILALAVAGALVSQPRREPTAGTLPTDTPTFAGVLVGTAVILTLLTYFVVLALGPIVEQLLMASQ